MPGNIPNLLVQREGMAVQLDYAGGPGDAPVYVGLALPGTVTSSATWRIMKLSYSGENLLSVAWANGNTDFVNVWDNRAGLPYS